jgi:hypothetical protein
MRPGRRDRQDAAAVAALGLLAGCFIGGMQELLASWTFEFNCHGILAPEELLDVTQAMPLGFQHFPLPANPELPPGAVAPKFPLEAV